MYDLLKMERRKILYSHLLFLQKRNFCVLTTIKLGWWAKQGDTVTKNLGPRNTIQIVGKGRIKGEYEWESHRPEGQVLYLFWWLGSNWRHPGIQGRTPLKIEKITLVCFFGQSILAFIYMLWLPMLSTSKIWANKQWWLLTQKNQGWLYCYLVTILSTKVIQEF